MKYLLWHPTKTDGCSYLTPTLLGNVSVHDGSSLIHNTVNAPLNITQRLEVHGATPLNLFVSIWRLQFFYQMSNGTLLLLSSNAYMHDVMLYGIIQFLPCAITNIIEGNSTIRLCGTELQVSGTVQLNQTSTISGSMGDHCWWKWPSPFFELNFFFSKHKQHWHIEFAGNLYSYI
jgi:hypothetical protein